MAKGKDERHNPNRKVSRPLSVEDEVARAFMTDEELALQDDDEKDVSSMSPQEIAKYNAQEQEKYRAPAHTKIELSKALWGK